MSDQPTIANQQVCPLCNSAEFYWEPEGWYTYCNVCGYEVDDDLDDEPDYPEYEED